MIREIPGIVPLIIAEKGNGRRPKTEKKVTALPKADCDNCDSAGPDPCDCDCYDCVDNPRRPSSKQHPV